MARRTLGDSDLDALLRACALTAGIVLARHGVTAAGAVLPPLVALTLGLSGGRRGRAGGPPGTFRPGTRLGLVAPMLLMGALVARFEIARDPVPALMRTWAARGFEAGTTPVELQARLLDLQPIEDSCLSLVVRIEQYRILRAPLAGTPRHPVTLRLTVPLAAGNPAPGWVPGDRLDLTARLGPPRNFRNPGAYDYRSALKAQGIDLTGTVKSDRLVTVIQADRQPWRALLPRARGWVVRRLVRAAGPGGGETASFLAALLVGEREELSPRLEQPLQRAGVYHIIALSGLNVAVMALLASLLLRALPIGPQGRRAGVATSVALYWAIARSGGSMTRAVLMAILYLGGAAAERRVRALGSISVAATLLLLQRPCWAWDVGFQLSFAATLALVVFARAPAAPRSGRSLSMRVLDSGLGRSLGVSAAALVGTALVTARHFQTATPVALVANLYAVPLANLLLVLALTIVASGLLLPSLATTLAHLAGRMIGALTGLSAILSSPRWLSYYVVPPPSWLVLWAGGAMILAGALPAGAWRRAARIALGAAILWTALRGSTASARPELEVTAFDVGQGDAVLVRFPTGTTMLIDAGGFARTSFDVGQRVVAPALRALGHLRLDILAVTHAHRDHLGGAAAILQQFSPAALWLGRMPEDDPAVVALERLAEESHVAVVRPRRGARLRVGGAALEFLNPGQGVPLAGEATNDDSLVIRIVEGRRAVLLTGDLEASLEAILLREGRGLAAELLKVGHHGSRTSTTAAFLARVDPRLAVISVGASNPWGHPDRVVLRRLVEAGVSVYRTDRIGAVSFRTDGLSPWAAEALAPPGAPDAPGVSRPGSEPE